MNSRVKLPLYLGLAVLIVAIIMSVVKISDKQAFTNLNSRANVSDESLILKFTPPNLVSVLLSGQKEITGADVILKFNSDKVAILPSSLYGGVDFVAAGGNVDTTAGVFSFSALAKKASVSSGIVANFQVVPLNEATDASADIQFDKTVTKIVEKASSQNILTNTQGLKFTTSAK